MYSNEQVPVTNPGQLPPMPQHQEWISILHSEIHYAEFGSFFR